MSWGRSTALAIAITVVAAIYAVLMFSAENSEPQAPPAEHSIEAPQGTPSPEREVAE